MDSQARGKTKATSTQHDLGKKDFRPYTVWLIHGPRAPKNMDELIEYASQVFESRQLACDWLNGPVAALGHRRPIELFETSEGRREVTGVLRKIECGEFS